MDTQKRFGLYLFKKDRKDLHVLKDLLQLLKSNTPRQQASFSYIEAHTSLIPDVSLWENLEIELGKGDWKEFCSTLPQECKALTNILKNPYALTSSAEAWEKLSISLLKGFLNPTQNLLVDMNEDDLPPLMLQNFKKTLLRVAEKKNVYLASAHSSLWLDCAHSLVSRKEYEFIIEKLNSDEVELHWMNNLKIA